MILTLIYTYYYSDGELSGDTAHYFNDGKILNQVFSESPQDYFTLLFDSGDQGLVESRLHDTEHWTRSELDQFNDNRFIIRINSLLSFISLDVFFVHMLFFIMASFLGLILFYKSIEDFIPKFKKELFLLLILYPSLLFWTSSVLKESLLILGFGMLIYGIRFFSIKSSWKIILIILGLFILMNTKIYFLFCLIPALFFYLILNSSWKRSWITYSLFVFLGVLFLGWNSTFEKFNITKYISQKQRDFNLVGKGGVYFMDEQNFYRIEYKDQNTLIKDHAYVVLKEDTQVEVKKFGELEYRIDSVLPKDSRFKFYSEQEPSLSYFKVPEVNDHWLNIVLYSPVYFSNVLLMPYPWQSGSILKWLNMIENVLLLLLLFLVLKYRKKAGEIDTKLFFFSLTFILIFYLIIGATTPVVGAIVRYKTPAFLIWILFFLSIIDFKRITLKPQKHKK
ncbi:MAG: hypothetical protein KDC84_14265 [Crocinitomicaceae bacterium]|nr:hypothetical protein [Crocinitomicaceae bacterium]